MTNNNEYTNQHNYLITKLAPALANELHIHPTDSVDGARNKHTKAKKCVKYYEYFFPLVKKKLGEVSFDFVGDAPEGPQPDHTVDKHSFTLQGADADAGINKDTDSQLSEKKSSTERVRRYYKRHPEKVRQYLKKTQNDRVQRNKDRKKAIDKYGKKKMKNHDVHHPEGTDGGKWMLARKDHGRDRNGKNSKKQT